jgi:hypothetical protein
MQLLLFNLVFIFTLASCSSYHYVTMDSTDITRKGSKTFSWETDTMSVAYQFSGEGGLMTITVFNKTSEPLYVNWKKSAVINNGEKVSLFDRNVIATGAIQSDNYHINRNQTTGYSNFLVSFDLPEGIDFLPPQSGLSKSVVNLQDITLNNLAVHGSVKQEKITTTEGIVKFRRVYYTVDESPLHFKTYITLALGKNAENEFSVQHSFYVREVVQSITDPNLFSMYQTDGRQFYIRQDVQ